MLHCVVMPHTPKLVPSAEVCERLEIDRSTLSRWVAAKRITPALQGPGPNGMFWFTEASVSALQSDVRSAS